MSKERDSRWYRKLGVQLILLILVCSLIPVGVTTYVAVGESQAALEDQKTHQLETNVGSVTKNAEDRAEVYEIQVRQVRDHPAVRNLVEKRYQNEQLDGQVDEFEQGAAYPELLGSEPEYRRALSYFDSVAETNENIDMIRVFWKDGNVLAGHRLGEEDRQDYKGDKVWFQRVVDSDEVGEDELYISNINIARATDSPAIRYALPIEVDGERVGLVIINYKASQITEAAENLEVGDSGYGAMVAPEYVTAEGDELGPAFVAHGSSSELAFDEDGAGDIYMPSEKLTGEEGSFNYDHNGERWHAEYERVEIGGEEYYAIATVPLSQMLGAATTIRNHGLLVAGISGLFVIGLGFVVTRRITNPIKALTADAKAIADGDYEREIQTSGSTSEVAQLSRSISGMKDNVITALEDAKEQREAAETAQQESQALADELEKQAAVFGDAIERAAGGDLTVRLETDIENDAMADIAEAFNEMLADLESTVNGLQTFADEVATTSEQVTTSTRDVSDASSEVSTSVQQIASGADDQAMQLQEVAQEMEQLSAMVEEIAGQAGSVAETSTEAAEIGTEGREAAAEAIEEMDAIERFAEQAVEAVESLETRFEEITETTDLIADIAEQTNMLALNANIEAARSETGEDGFGVVADEVKQLADESKQSATEIEAMVETTHEQMETAVDSVRRAQERIDRGTETVSEAVEAFDEVVTNIEATNEGVQDIDDATAGQADSTQEVASIVDDVAQISEETTAEAESASAAAEEQTSSLEEVLTRTRDLSEQAADLQERLAAFDTGDAESESAPSAL
jgi:methyl-accepting chemotaxis protein